MPAGVAPPASPASIWDIIKEIEPLVGWAFIIVGWAVVRWDSNRREDRHELRTKIDSVTAMVRAFEEKAHEYYLCEHADTMSGLRELQLIRSQTALETELNILRAKNRSFQDFVAWQNYQNAVTGHDFKSKTREKAETNGGRIIEISQAAKELIRYLEDQYEAEIKLLKKK